MSGAEKALGIHACGAKRFDCCVACFQRTSVVPVDRKGKGFRARRRRLAGTKAWVGKLPQFWPGLGFGLVRHLRFVERLMLVIR